MQRLRTVTSLDVSAVAGHHAMPAALLFLSCNVEFLSVSIVVLRVYQKESLGLLHCHCSITLPSLFNPVVLRKAKIVYNNFGSLSAIGLK